MPCNGCGKQLPTNAPFCNYCGARQLAASPEPPKKHQMRWLAICGFVVVVAAVAVLVGFQFKEGFNIADFIPSSPKDTVSQPDSTPKIPDADEYISKIRNGVMTGYDDTTIGKAFESTFRNPKWTAGETSKGARFVEFTGILPEELYNDYRHKVEEFKRCAIDAEGFKKDVRKEFAEEMGRRDYNGPLLVEMLTRDDYAMLESGAWRQPFLDFVELACKTNPGDEKSYAGEARFQWTFTADIQAFKLSYIDLEPWEKVSTASTPRPANEFFVGPQAEEKILAFIYR